MKNITLSADERLIEEARERARADGTTLNAEFRRWLKDYSGRAAIVARHVAVMEDLGARYSTGGRRFTRDELNER